MKILIAPDSFKGSISSIDAANAIRDGIMEVSDGVDCLVLPMADGGEGTLRVIAGWWNGQLIEEAVPNALGKEIVAVRGRFNSGKTAVIELAEASGLAGLTRKNPWKASTYGTGIQVRNALNEGASEIILALGGSATVDGGTGLMAALGFKFFVDKDKDYDLIHNYLYDFYKVDISDVDKRFTKVKWTVLADVNNPLVGNEGGIRVYGPQKGLAEKDISILEEQAIKWADALNSSSGRYNLYDHGIGAAGGAALPLVALRGVTIQNGFEWISKQMNIENRVKEVDMVITGEGRLDEQTLMGKGPGALAGLAKKHEKKIIAIAGSATKDLPGFDKIFTLDRFSASHDQLMKNPAVYLKEVAKQMVFNLRLF